MILVRIPFIGRKAIAFFPFVFFKERSDRHDLILMNHERIHLQQQLELLILPFYLLYLINYLYNLITTGDHDKAYRNIIFEKEAYTKERDPAYLKNRKHFAFIYYL
jgi:hypothetical protein